MSDAVKLLDNGWQILLFRDGLGQYSALAVRDGASVDEAIARWADHEPDERAEGEAAEQWSDRHVFGGPNRYCGCGVTIADALAAVTEKVLFRRLPGEARDAGE